MPLTKSAIKTQITSLWLLRSFNFELMPSDYERTEQFECLPHCTLNSSVQVTNTLRQLVHL